MQRHKHNSTCAYPWDFKKVIMIGPSFGNEEEQEMGMDMILKDSVRISC